MTPGVAFDLSTWGGGSRPVERAEARATNGSLGGGLVASAPR
jgi:hypothetical protein